MLEAARIDESTPLEVSTNGDVIIVTPVRERKRTAKLQAAVETIEREFAGAFKRLAE